METRRGSKQKNDSECVPDDRGGPLTLESIQNLILQSEGRVMAKLANIETKISAIEFRLDMVQTEQMRLSSEVDKLKDVVVMQQKHIEQFETKNREKYLIFSGVPESSVSMEEMTLGNDVEKISFLCDQIGSEIDSASIHDCSRIGPKEGNRTRLVRVKFNSVRARNFFLRSQRSLREDRKVRDAFGPIYINPDRSHLARKEDTRLREKMKKIRSTSSNPRDVFIRSGKLYVKSEIVDRVDIANQLF